MRDRPFRCSAASAVSRAPAAAAWRAGALAERQLPAKSSQSERDQTPMMRHHHEATEGELRAWEPATHHIAPFHMMHASPV